MALLQITRLSNATDIPILGSPQLRRAGTGNPAAQFAVDFAMSEPESLSYCAGAAGMPINAFIESGEFDPEAIAAMSKAFDAACKEIHYSGSRAAFEVIAERIIAAIRIGERDPIRLQAAALAGLPRKEE